MPQKARLPVLRAKAATPDDGPGRESHRMSGSGSGGGATGGGGRGSEAGSVGMGDARASNSGGVCDRGDSNKGGDEDSRGAGVGLVGGVEGEKDNGGDGGVEKEGVEGVEVDGEGGKGKQGGIIEGEVVREGEEVEMVEEEMEMPWHLRHDLMLESMQVRRCANVCLCVFVCTHLCKCA